MAIRTQQSVSGFIASDPQLSFTERGDARFYARVGQEHYQHNDDGTFTKLDNTFHDLVAFRRTAERAYEQFRKGDAFLAEGYVRTYSHADGQPREEFIAKRIGHDTARTTYAIDRTPRREPAAEAAAHPAAATLAASAQPPAATSDRTATTGPSMSR